MGVKTSLLDLICLNTLIKVNKLIGAGADMWVCQG